VQRLSIGVDTSASVAMRPHPCRLIDTLEFGYFHDEYEH
jgi:hypothetical protein